MGASDIPGQARRVRQRLGRAAQWGGRRVSGRTSHTKGLQGTRLQFQLYWQPIQRPRRVSELCKSDNCSSRTNSDCCATKLAIQPDPICAKEVTAVASKQAFGSRTGTVSWRRLSLLQRNVHRATIAG